MVEKQLHLERLYEKRDFDYLFVLCVNGDKYYIPIDKIFGKTTITVGQAWNDFKLV